MLWRLCGFTLLCIWGILGVSCQQESSSENKKVAVKNELQEIDQELLDIQHQLSKYRQKAFGHEMDAQNDLLLSKWKTYGHEILEEEQNEELIHSLEKREHELTERKKILQESAKKR